MYRLSVTKIKTIKKHLTSVTAAFVLAATSLSGAAPLFFSQKAFADTAITISSVTDLCNAIQNQADNQTWVIVGPGPYALTQCNSVSAGGQTGWYFPITANNLTIRGIGNPTIYGDGFTADGAWHTQDLMAIFGNNVTIDGLTLMPKVEPNKTIEVMGSNATIENTTITPNTLADSSEYASIPSDPSDPNWSQEAKGWGGSIYYNDATGTQTLSNVQIYNGGVSVHAPTASITTTNLQLTYDTNVDWINDYRFYNSSNSVIHGAPTYTYHVTATLNNFDSVLKAVGDPTTLIGSDTISLDSNLTTGQQVTLTKPVTLNGNDNSLSPDFTKTNTSNNAALGIQSNNVTVNNLVVNGANGVELHGINVYNATGVNLNDVTVENNPYSGLNVDRSAVTVTNLTTSHNGWDGVDVDKPGAVLTVNGTSHHTETTPDIYVDNATVGKVIDTNNQYGFVSNVKQAGDRAYNLKPSVPVATLFDANGDSINKGSISTNSFTFHLSSSANVARYQLRYWNDIPGSQFNGESHAWSPTNLSTTGHMNVLGVYTDSFTQGEGTHYFAFSACDAYGICSDFSSPFVVTYDATVITDNFTVNMLTGDKVTLAPTVTSQTGPLTYAWSVSDPKLLNYPQDTKTGAALVIGPAPKDNYTVTLTVRDKYGYLTVATYVVTIADHASPVAVTPQVLGSSTSSTSSTGSRGSTTQEPATADTASYNDGEVLGAQTTTPSQNTNTTNSSNSNQPAAPSNVETLRTNKSDTINHSRFLLLGWWWLVIVAALVGFFWLLLGRHSDHDAQ